MSQGFREKYNVPSVPYGSNVISIHFLKVWTNGGARELELETLNLRWLMLTLSSMSVPNFTTFPQSVLWAAIDLRRKRKNNNNNNNNNNKNPNGYNRCLNTFGAWPLIIIIRILTDTIGA